MHLTGKHHETTLIKWGVPPSTTHTVPAPRWSSDCGRGGKESQGPIQHGPILNLPAASHYLMKRPRSLPGTKPQRREDTVCTIIHTRWTNAYVSRGDEHLPRQYPRALRRYHLKVFRANGHSVQPVNIQALHKLNSSSPSKSGALDF